MPMANLATPLQVVCHPWVHLDIKGYGATDSPHAHVCLMLEQILQMVFSRPGSPQKQIEGEDS